MKKIALVFASTLAFSSAASALDLKTFLSEPHDSLLGYDYVEGSLLIQPHNFKGFEVRGSRVVRDNIAVTGVLSSVKHVGVTATNIGVGARYFFALSKMEDIDLDISSALIRASADGHGAKVSSTGLLLGTQLRRVLDRSIGNTSMQLEEVYGGVQVGISSGDSSAALHVGLLMAINPQFSARAEVLADDGMYLSFGVRMKLGLPQNSPETLGTKAALVKDSSPHGLSDEEKASFQDVLEQK